MWRINSSVSSQPMQLSVIETPYFRFSVLSTGWLPSFRKLSSMTPAISLLPCFICSAASRKAMRCSL